MTIAKRRSLSLFNSVKFCSDVGPAYLKYQNSPQSELQQVKP